jgi:hypothetical protein
MKSLPKLLLAGFVGCFVPWSSVAQQKQPTVTFFHGNKVSFSMPAIGYAERVALGPVVVCVASSPIPQFSVYSFDPALHVYSLRDKYLTSGKYASFDEVDVISVLEPEREEILARLKRQH